MRDKSYLPGKQLFVVSILFLHLLAEFHLNEFASLPHSSQFAFCKLVVFIYVRNV